VVDPTTTGKYTTFIWDLNLSKKILERGAAAVELFFTAHNLFNGSQYLDGTFPSPRRWFEGGARFKF
jgi:vitamin B12 transporter